MTRRLVLIALVAACNGILASSLWAVPAPIFYTPLENEADSITNNPTLGAGSTPDDDFQFVAGYQGNAFTSTTNTPNAGGYARWSTTVITSMFSTWNDANGITIDHYFRGTWTGLTGTIDEGFWAMVRRNNVGGLDPGDEYFFTSVRTGKLRLGISNESANQYKYTFDGSTCGGSACSGSNQEKVQGVNIPLNDETIYHLTVSLGNGELKVWLDDANGSQYDNLAPKFTDSTVIPDGYNWTLPVAATVGGTAGTGRLTREMTVGSRGATQNSNFGGTLRTTTWVDEVKIYNGVYTPAELVATTVQGDYNGNGFVDAADYILWRKGVQPLPSGEVDNIGTTDAQDYTEWQSRFGNPTPGGGGDGLASGVIPEPATSVFALMCVCITFALHRSRR